MLLAKDGDVGRRPWFSLSGLGSDALQFTASNWVSTVVGNGWDTVGSLTKIGKVGCEK